MVGNKKYFTGNSNMNGCNEKEKKAQVQMDTSFIKDSLTSKASECQGIWTKDSLPNVLVC